MNGYAVCMNTSCAHRHCVRGKCRMWVREAGDDDCEDLESACADNMVAIEEMDGNVQRVPVKEAARQLDLFMLNALDQTGDLLDDMERDFEP